METLLKVEAQEFIKGIKAVINATDKKRDLLKYIKISQKDAMLILEALDGLAYFKYYIANAWYNAAKCNYILLHRDDINELIKIKSEEISITEDDALNIYINIGGTSKKLKQPDGEFISTDLINKQYFNTDLNTTDIVFSADNLSKLIKAAKSADIKTIKIRIIDSNKPAIVESGAFNGLILPLRS